MAFKVLIAEDEEITVKHLTNALKAEGCLVTSTMNGLDALQKIEAGSFDLLIADIKMPGMTGIELLARVKEKSPETDVVIITGFGSIGSAVDAMKKGATEYITKPFDLDELTLKVNKIRDRKGLLRENIALKTYLGMEKKVSIIAKSKSMKDILETIEGIKDSESNIFLTGETGVGKSLLARIVHFTSKRQERPFLSINCATLTEELLASELFGHERGAFTGATALKRGLFEVARGGTCFLDEIGDMSPAVQSRLLRVLQEHEIKRVGGTEPIRVDVRVIAATNKHLETLVKAHTFRDDLFYRLSVVTITLPPLRERPDDIPLLAEFFLRKFSHEAEKRVERIAPEAMALLAGYSWPGNVREIEHIIERAVVLTQNPTLLPQDLPPELQAAPGGKPSTNAQVLPLREVERRHLLFALERAKGNRKRAAEWLGVTRRTLYRMAARHGIKLASLDD